MSKKISAAKRLRILQRDGFACFYCGCELHLDEFDREDPTHTLHKNFGYLDHVNPQVNGGTRADENLVATCRFCNSSKGGRDLETFRQVMIARQPHVQAALHIQSALRLMVSPVAPQLYEALAWYQAQSIETRFPGEIRRAALAQAVKA